MQLVAQTTWELWGIMIYHCRLIYCNKCTTLEENEAVPVLEQGVIWEMSAQFCCEPKTTLTNKVHWKKITDV